MQFFCYQPRARVEVVAAQFLVEVEVSRRRDWLLRNFVISLVGNILVADTTASSCSIDMTSSGYFVAKLHQT